MFPRFCMPAAAAPVARLQFTPKPTVRWELRARRVNQPLPLHHLTPLSARGCERGRLITWPKTDVRLVLREHRFHRAISLGGETEYTAARFWLDRAESLILAQKENKTRKRNMRRVAKAAVVSGLASGTGGETLGVGTGADFRSCEIRRRKLRVECSRLSCAPPAVAMRRVWLPGWDDARWQLTGIQFDFFDIRMEGNELNRTLPKNKKI